MNYARCLFHEFQLDLNIFDDYASPQTNIYFRSLR